MQVALTHWMVVTVLFSERASAKSAKPLSLRGFEPSLYMNNNMLVPDVIDA